MVSRIDEISRICPRPPRFHVPDRLLGQVQERHQVHLDDPPDDGRVLVSELGVMSEPGVIDQQVEPAWERLGPVPEAVAEVGVGQVAGLDEHPPLGQLTRQGFEPVEPPRGRQHRHPAVADELADQLPSQPGRGPRHQRVSQHEP
jgi:hypothetical protein